MKKTFVSLLLSFLAVVGYAEGLYDHLTDDQFFLNDSTFYIKKFECDHVLPNGIRLLYLEEKDVIPPYYPSVGKSRETFEWEHTLDYMVLVVLRDDNTGRKFRGLARKTEDGNYEPLYGMVGKNYEYFVFFSHDERLKPKGYPTAIKGNYYLDHIYNYLEEDPNKHWEKLHPGKRLTYPVYGKLPETDYDFQPALTGFDVLLHLDGAGSFTTCYSSGSTRVPVREYASSTITSGGKTRGVRDDTGGFTIDYCAAVRYATKVNYDSSENILTLTFGNRTVEKIDITRQGTPLTPENYDDTNLWVLKRDWNRNPDKLHLVKALNAWKTQSPMALWGSISVYVWEYKDWLAVYGCKNGTDEWWYTVWPREGYEGRSLDLKTRALVANRLLNRYKNSKK